VAITPDPLTTLTILKTYLTIPLSDTLEDSLLNQLITSVSALITESCNRQFFLSTNAANPITSYLSATGGQWIVLPVWPVQSITSIFEDYYGYYGQNPNGFQPDTQLTAGQDYALRVDQPDGSSRSAMVLKIASTWQTQYNSQLGMLSWYNVGGLGNIMVNYVAGFPTVPSDLQLACCRCIAMARLSGPYGNKLKNGSFEGDWSYALEAANATAFFGLLGDDVAPVLARYRITAVAAPYP
jgi:hypothetical protein